MAFRKTVRGQYCPPVFYHRFGEEKYSESSADGSTVFMSRDFVPIGELSASALPLTTLDSVIKSGHVIDGSVSFKRSDPALIERDVHSSVSSYLQSVSSALPSDSPSVSLSDSSSKSSFNSLSNLTPDEN